MTGEGSSREGGRGNALLDRATGMWLWYQGLPLHVSLALSGRRFRRARPPALQAVTVALCQMNFTLVGSASEFARKMHRFVSAAVQKGAQFVVFPEYTGAQLIGLIPSVAHHAAGHTLQTAADAMGTSLGEIFRTVAPASLAIYKDTFSILAQRFGVTIAAGTIVTVGDGGRLYNTMHLFGASGELIGKQPKLHLTAGESGWLARGDTLNVFELPFGRVALPVSMDHSYWETGRLAWLRGAEILVDAAVDSRGEVESLRARGVRMRVHEAPVYGLHAFMCTDLFELHWRGRSAVHAPPPLLPAGQNVLAQARSDKEEEVVVATLDLAALRKYRRENAPEFNAGLVARYFPVLYDRAQPANQPVNQPMNQPANLT